MDLKDSIPANWLVTTIGGVCSQPQYGYTTKAANQGNLHLLRTTDITRGLINWETVPYCSVNPDDIDKYLLKDGDVVISRAGSVGVSYLLVNPKHSVFASYLIRFRPNINQRFFRHFLDSPYYWEQISENRLGIAVPNVNASKLKNIPFPLPPPKEQNRIVAKLETLLSELDKGIESLKTAREQLKVYRQAVLKHAFEGKLTAHWREQNTDKLETPKQTLARIPVPVQPRGGRMAGAEVIEGIAALSVNSPTKEAPDGWLWTPLLRIARQETGHTPSRKHPEYWSGDQHWIGIVDARHHHGQVIQDTLQKPTELGLENSSARILPAGTVCLSRTASVGYVTILGKPMATSQDFATWSCTEALNPKFLMYALMAEGNEIRRFGKGTTHTTIYFPEIRALHICLPSVQEQKVIVEAVETKLQEIDKTIQEIELQLKRSDALRQSILKKAFSGQLVPQDPNDEPASALLARIEVKSDSQVAKPKKPIERSARAASQEAS